jgi:hypothetical protein
MTEQLIIEESKHEAAEEMHFWPAVREHLANGGTLADEAIGQEQEAKEVLAKLDKLNADDPEFEALLGRFTTAAREHIAFEELKVWPSLREMLTRTAAEELGTRLSQAKDKRRPARTRTPPAHPVSSRPQVRRPQRPTRSATSSPTGANNPTRRSLQAVRSGMAEEVKES